MKDTILDIVTIVGILCALVLAADALPRALAAVRRRRRAHGGAFGVVVDRHGVVLGTYLDPFGHPWRTPRLHEDGSPWVDATPDGQAWEGFGRTEDDAYMAANRLRRRHLQLSTWLQDDDYTDDGFLIPQPYLPDP